MNLATLCRQAVISALLAGLLVVGGVPRHRIQAAEKHVVLAVGSDPTTLDPDKIAGGGDYMFFSNVFESLYGHDLNGKLAPELATSYTMSKDGKTFEFRLRPHVLFHNGDTFSAEDVRFSWQRCIDPALKNPRAGVLCKNISDVQIVNSHRVRVHLKKVDAAFMQDLGEYWYMVPKRYIQRVGNAAFGAHPVGTGPYAFVSRAVLQDIEFKAFKQHWGRVPGIDRLTYRIVSDAQTRMAMLNTGEADIIQNVPPFLADQVRNTPGLKLITHPSYQNISIQFNTIKGPLTDVRVRRAFNYAVDKQTLIKKVMFGTAKQEASWCAVGIIGCDPAMKPYAYDPAKAKKLLHEANYNFNQTIHFVCLAPGRVPQTKELCESIAAYLSRVGVKTRIDMREYGSWLATLGAKHKPYDSVQMIFHTWTDYNADPQGRMLRGVLTGSNYSWISFPQVDALIKDGGSITNPAKRFAHYSKIFHILHDQAAHLFLWNLEMIYGARDNIDWTPRVGVSWPVMWKLDKR